MYFTHTTTRQVLAFDYSFLEGNISNQRVFYQHEGPGEPDGFRIDVEGNLWHAIYGEGRGEFTARQGYLSVLCLGTGRALLHGMFSTYIIAVMKISPEGRIIGEVKLPTQNITCTQFVGTELFITSAGDPEGSNQSREYGGGLFRVDVGIGGLEPFKFKNVNEA